MIFDDSDKVLILDDLRIYNEVDSDGYVKIAIEDGKVNSEYVHVSELDRIIKFLENIKNSN